MPEIKSPSRAELSDFIQTHPLFAGLDRIVIENLVDNIEIVSLRAGQEVFAYGDPGDSMFVIFKGILGVTIPGQGDGTEQKIAQLEAGEIAGEISILTGARRTATIRAIDDTVLAKITRTVFDAVFADHPENLKAITAQIRRRLHENQMIRVLPGVFGPMPDEILEALIANAVYIHLERGERLFKQGDPSDHLYIVLSGRLFYNVFSDDGSLLDSAEIGFGESVGEMGILTGEPRTADIYALRDTALVAFSSQFFLQISNRHPGILQNLSRTIVHRLQQTMQGRPLNQVAAQLALVPLSPETGAFGERLTEAIQNLGFSALYVDPDRFERSVLIPNAAALDLDDPSGIRLQSWFDEQEAHYDYVVYLADPGPTLWTKRIAQQADQVLFVAVSDDDPGLRPVEAQFGARPGGRAVQPALALIRPDGSAFPSGTGRWLDLRPAGRHYHLRAGNAEDLDRLARHITGRAVGLVLGGGGARGMAHIGVIRALQELGIPVDRIGGTSIGAAVGGQFAFGQDVDEMVATNKKLDHRSSYDYTLPIVSMMATVQITNRLQEQYGDMQIEDLPIPYFAVSANLTKASTYVHQRGLLWKAIRASGGPAGLTPPIFEDGDLLVDGGLLDNLPIDLMRDLIGGGTVIAVDVSPPVELADFQDYGPGLSGWKVLFNRLNPFQPRLRVPGIVSILHRAGSINTIFQQSRKLTQNKADVYIAPDVDAFDFLGYSKTDELVERGYQAAIRDLSAWKNSPA